MSLDLVTILASVFVRKRLKKSRVEIVDLIDLYGVNTVFLDTVHRVR